MTISSIGNQMGNLMVNPPKAVDQITPEQLNTISNAAYDKQVENQADKQATQQAVRQAGVSKVYVETQQNAIDAYTQSANEETSDFTYSISSERDITEKYIAVLKNQLEEDPSLEDVISELENAKEHINPITIQQSQISQPNSIESYQSVSAPNTAPILNLTA